MESRSTLSFRPFLAPTLAMIVLGWSGLALVVTQTDPLVWWRWAFFVLWILALTGTALPVTYFLNRRFPGDPPAGPNAIARQAIWVGVYGAMLAWLQLGRLVTLWVILGLAVGLTSIEYIIRMRERSHWKPTPPPDSELTDSQSADS